MMKVLIILLAVIACIFGCTKLIAIVIDKEVEMTAQANKIKGRFEVISEFYTFGGNPNSKKGKILKDTITGKCYISPWIGDYRGGTGFIETDKSECGG